ncbi:MAG: sterol desaturase family protein [Alphaproteobacteria bacterium]
MGLLFVMAFFGMEAAAWIIHRYIMHGPLWVLHRSHHEPRQGPFERNDWFAVLFSLPAVAAIFVGFRGVDWLLPIGFGISAYGLAYVLAHDVLVHRRIRLLGVPKSGYLARLHEAHMLHHAVRERTGGVSFGFLYAPDTQHLRRMLDARKAAPRFKETVF